MGISKENNSIFDLESDKIVKKKLLIDTISTHCEYSSHKILQQIDQQINLSGDGSKLEATILSGGYTNYSYKVYVDKHPELCIFAKICFEYALWNPDRTAHYDLKRTENEFEIMQSISAKTPDCVVTPLACWDVKHDGQKMKVLVTEWSKGDEQFCNQVSKLYIVPQMQHTRNEFNHHLSILICSLSMGL